MKYWHFVAGVSLVLYLALAFIIGPQDALFFLAGCAVSSVLWMKMNRIRNTVSRLSPTAWFN